MRVTRGIIGGAVAALLLASVLIQAQQGANGQGRSGFRALNAAEAADFQVPAGMRLLRSQRFGSAGQIAAERYVQFVGNAEVLGGQLTVYRDDTGLRSSVIGAHYPNLTPANSIRLTAGAAQAIASSRRTIAGGDWLTTLMIHPDTSRYFYRVENRGFDQRWFYWIDADTGAVINEYDGLTTGSGTGVLGDTKDLSGLTNFYAGTTTVTTKTNRGGKTTTTTTTTPDEYRMSTLRLETYDARNQSGLPGVRAADSDDNWNLAGRTSPGQPALVDAHFFANVTDVFYSSTFNFNWTDHFAQGIVSSAHVSNNYNNAYWNGTQMAYGDGDGTTFVELSGDLDVVGHELSHGVTEATSNLIYQGESGALNEAFSDIMGTAIEYNYGSGNWTIGEDIYKAGQANQNQETWGIRSLKNPGLHGDPSHYADRYTGTSDSGGVHTNSGIANHWFYLLSMGGQNATASRASGTNVQGIGLAAAEEIAFLGFTGLPATATFCAARASTISVAGSDANNVADAWDEVGVDEALCGNGSNAATGPVISNVTSRIVSSRRGSFAITWTTDVAANSEVTFTCCGTYSNSSLVTSHSMSFNGSKGYLYEYYVSSTDAAGHKSVAGPYTHQN